MSICLRLLVSSVIVAALASCGDVDAGKGSLPNGKLDRTDVEAVAKGLVTAFVEVDFKALRALVLPDQREAVEDLSRTTAVQGPTKVTKVRVSILKAKVSGDTALVDYDATYCVPAHTTEVPITVPGDPSGGGPSSVVGTTLEQEPEKCVRLSDIFTTSGVEYRRIDAKWFGPLPA